MKRIRALLMVLAMTGGGVAVQLAGVSSASAYGKAVYQITFSQNCNNAQFCLGGPGGLGGDWGWAALYADGTGDLQVTGCGHGGGGPGGAGAAHEAVEFYSWSIDTTTGLFYVGSASDPSFVGDTPIPAAPGHYSLHPAPGVAIEITVQMNPTS